MTIFYIFLKKIIIIFISFIIIFFIFTFFVKLLIKKYVYYNSRLPGNPKT